MHVWLYDRIFIISKPVESDRDNASCSGILLRRILFSGCTIKKNVRRCSDVSDFCKFVKMAMKLSFEEDIDDLQKP